MAKPIRAYNVDGAGVSLGGYHVNGGSADSAVVGWVQRPRAKSRRSLAYLAM